MPDEKKTTNRAAVLATGAALLAAACGGGSTEPPPPPPPASANCDAPTEVVLTPGQHVVVDPSASNGCVSIPAQGPGATEREYLIALTSGSGQITASGVSGPYAIRVALHAAPASAPHQPFRQLVIPSIAAVPDAGCRCSS